jgi:hypothetical protein
MEDGMTKKRDRTDSTSITLKKETHTRLREFADGIGGSNDEAVAFLLKEVGKGDESPLLAGVRLRPKFQSRK